MISVAQATSMSESAQTGRARDRYLVSRADASLSDSAADWSTKQFKFTRALARIAALSLFWWSLSEWLCPEQKKETTLSRTVIVHTRRGSPDPRWPRLLEYIPACISMYVCVCIVYVLHYNTCKYRLGTYHNTHHNTSWCPIHQIHIGMITIHANTYQHALACITLVFGMYESWYVQIQTKYRLFFLMCANTNANTLTNTIPIQSNTDQYKSRCSPTQSTNTDKCTHHFL